MKKVVSGVCHRLAEKTNMNVLVFQLLFIILDIGNIVSAALLYFCLAILMDLDK